MQVRIVGVLRMDVPVMGPFEMTFDKITAPGFFRLDEKVDAKRTYASWFIDSETGEIMIEGTDHILMYDKEDKEYWLESPENYFKEQDTSSEGKKSFSFSFGSDEEDEDSPLKIERMGGDAVEVLHGFRTKKWITTVTSSDGELVLEEWFVDKLPLLDLSESLERDIKIKFNPSREALEMDQFEFSSNLLIAEFDSLTSLKPLEGHSVKTNFLMYEDDDLKFSAGYEILELYTVPFDASSFTIPEEYSRVEKD